VVLADATIFSVLVPPGAADRLADGQHDEVAVIDHALLEQDLLGLPQQHVAVWWPSG
jgi:hypothetical protein